MTFKGECAVANLDLQYAYQVYLDALNAAGSITEIDKIWCQLEDLVSSAESHFRVSLNESGPTLAEASDWLTLQVKELRANSVGGAHPPHPSALQSAERLVRAVLHDLGTSELRAEIVPASLGRVLVRWTGETELQWMVGAVALPWPGTRVRTYFSRDPDSLRLNATTFHLANDAVSHASKVLRGL
jgi:hypothetical protein